MRRDICFGAKATPNPKPKKMTEKWMSNQRERFQGNTFINTLQKKFPSRFPSRWSAVKFARGLFREGIIFSASNLNFFEDSEQLYSWKQNDAVGEWRKMTTDASTTWYRGHTSKKRVTDEPDDTEIISTVKQALSGAPRKDNSLINKFFKELQKDFPESNTSSKQRIERTWVNQRHSTASSESSADTITHSYPKFKEKQSHKNQNSVVQMASTARSYGAIPEEEMSGLDRSHGTSSLEYELTPGSQQNMRRWQDSQFCYSDNEKQLIEEMKKMKRDHNESIQAYEERISKLMAKMHELKGIAEMLENSSMKSSPYGLLPGRNNLISMFGNRQEKKGAAPFGFNPPPLPPRPAKGNKVYPNKPIIHPKCKMKHLDWSRIILKDGSQNTVTTLWHTMAEPKIDVEELERLFSGVRYNLYDDIVNRREKSKHQYVTILASDQSRRLVSTMKILPCELPTVVEGITQMDYHVVPSDRFVELVEVLATCNEIDKVMYHVKRKGPANIDHPEFLISELSKVDHFQDRIEFMRFKKKVQWHLFEIDQQLRELHTACDEICNSMALRNLLETLLAVGNYMNGGTENGQADGFTIDTMNKLKEIQDKDNKTNLLEFVLKMYCQMYETEVDVSCPTRFRLPEPSNMRHAAQVSFETIHETLSSLHGELKIHKEKVLEVFQQNGNVEKASHIKSIIDSFHLSATNMLTEEESLLSDTKDVYLKTANYFLYDEVPNKPQNFFQIWAVFLHDCKYFWKLAHRRIAKERFEQEFRFKGHISMSTSHGFDNYRANMFRHLTHLKNSHEQKDMASHIKHVNNWMDSSEVNLKPEPIGNIGISNTNDIKNTPQRTNSPKPFTSEPPNSASVHKPQPMKSGSTPPHYENQEEFDAYTSKTDSQNGDRIQSLNQEKVDKTQFSFKSWLKREPGKRNNSGESKSSGEDKKSEQAVDPRKQQQGETTLSKIKHSVVQKFSSSTSTSKHRQQQCVQNTYVSTEQCFQTPPSYVPLNLNVNDIDPYETSLGRESRFGTMSSEIDLRPRAFDKGLFDENDVQVNSAERRSKFDASKFTYKNVKTRQGSDISTEYASLYHTPPFFSPPVTHIDKDGYASPITLTASSKSDINNNETSKNRFQGSDVHSRNRAPLALGSNVSISDAYAKDNDQTGAKRFHTETNETPNRLNPNLHHSNISKSCNFPVDTPTSRSGRDEHNDTNVKSSHYVQASSEKRSNEFGKPPLHRRHWETPPVKPERTLERYPASQNLSMNHDLSQKEARNVQHIITPEQILSVHEERKFLTKSAMNRPPITSLIKRFEKEENDPSKETSEQSSKQTMLSTSTPITPRRPMTLHDDDDDNPPPLPPRYDTNSSTTKYGSDTNTNPLLSQQPQTDPRYQRTPIKSNHLRQNTGASDQDEGYKDRLRKVANSAVFDRYKSPNMTPNRQGVPQTGPQQYARQSSNQSQFSQNSSVNQSNVPVTPNRQQYGRNDENQMLNSYSSPFNKQTPSQHNPPSQTRKAGLGRFANTGVYQTQGNENRTSIHL